MSTKFICDVCEEEFTTNVQLSEVRIIPRINHPATQRFDICSSCRDKMFKPVAHYHALYNITVNWEDKD